LDIAGTAWRETGVVNIKSPLGKEFVSLDSPLWFFPAGDGRAAPGTADALYMQKGRKVYWTITARGVNSLADLWESAYLELFGTVGQFTLKRYRRRYKIKSSGGVPTLAGRVSYRGVVLSSRGKFNIRVKARTTAFPDPVGLPDPADLVSAKTRGHGSEVLGTLAAGPRDR
jgi:hypothetical protein